MAWSGIDVHRDLGSIGHRIHYVGHRRGVCGDLTPFENLKFASDLHRSKGRTDPLSAVKKVGLAGVANTMCSKLSAGQNQRTALARLLVTDAPLWCLDEPFTALDSVGRDLFESMISDNADNGGISMVATHQPLSLKSSNIKTLDLDRR